MRGDGISSPDDAEAIIQTFSEKLKLRRGRVHVENRERVSGEVPEVAVRKKGSGMKRGRVMVV